MIPYDRLPALNATLNFTSAILLAAGYLLIRRRRITLHRLAMSAALLVSTLFLVSYLTYHRHAGVVHYQGSLKVLYFALLISHTILAMAIVPLAVTTLSLALAGRWETHKRWARWTLPIWFYISVTGVVIYEMLY